MKNQGSAPANNINLQGTLPQALQFVDARGDSTVQSQGQQLQFAPITTLEPGARATWYVQATATEAAGPSQFQVQMQSDVTPQPVISQEPTTLY